MAAEIEEQVRANVDKLYDKTPARAPRAAAVPVELPVPAEATPAAPTTKAAAKQSIDITVDDD